MNELTLQQALTIYLKALCECANQSITKKSAIYPSTNSVKEFLAEIKILAKKGD